MWYSHGLTHPSIAKEDGATMSAEANTQKPIVFTSHARQRMKERGASEEAVRQAIRIGEQEPGKEGRVLYRLNVEFKQHWDGRYFGMQQVAPVVADEKDRLVVITVYTFYFKEGENR
jgi:hypothetical protein